MRHTFVVHISLDTGTTDPEHAMADIEAHLRANAGLDTLQDALTHPAGPLVPHRNDDPFNRPADPLPVEVACTDTWEAVCAHCWAILPATDGFSLCADCSPGTTA